MKFIEWGEVEYTEATERQIQELAEVQNGGEDRVIFCTHPPVVTKGRGTKEYDILNWTGQLVESSRGGRATYHGPSQVVMYPIINLDRIGAPEKRRDLHGYLRAIEQAIITLLASYDIKSGTLKESVKDRDGDSLVLTGVWTGEKKIASLGVAVKKWVTYHGAAINVYADPLAFEGLNPCGFPATTMTCMEDQTASPLNREELHKKLFYCLQESLAGLSI